MRHRFVTIAITPLVVVAGLGIALGTTRHSPIPGARAETVTFAGGCFWGLEAAFREVPGVTDTVAGYTGGASENRLGEDVSLRRVNHLEACCVTYDPARISYQRLVEYFLEIHNGSIADRKSPYLGSPARLVIFFHNPEERKIAEDAKRMFPQPGEANRGPLIQILSEGQFDRAEEYNQHYLEKHGLANCRVGS